MNVLTRSAIGAVTCVLLGLVPELPTAEAQQPSPVGVIEASTRQATTRPSVPIRVRLTYKNNSGQPVADVTPLSHDNVAFSIRLTRPDGSTSTIRPPPVLPVDQEPPRARSGGTLDAGKERVSFITIGVDELGEAILKAAGTYVLEFRVELADGQVVTSAPLSVEVEEPTPGGEDFLKKLRKKKLERVLSDELLAFSDEIDKKDLKEFDTLVKKSIGTEYEIHARFGLANLVHAWIQALEQTLPKSVDIDDNMAGLATLEASDSPFQARLLSLRAHFALSRRDLVASRALAVELSALTDDPEAVEDAAYLFKVIPHYEEFGLPDRPDEGHPLEFFLPPK